MTVYLVGAGPGDPGLITVRGAEVLGTADVVAYDRLIDQSLLDLAPPRAERIDVGKSPGGPIAQDEINALLVERARAGQEVVRLKGGDPFVLGRGGEEAEALRAAGVPFEVVPGITSAVAVPAYAGIPVTHRGLSTSFTVVTGHSRHATDTAVNWEALAQAGGTLVVLMGVAHRREIAERLVAGGLPPGTPVAAVRWGTFGAQQSVRSSLADLPDLVLEPPVTLVIGRVAGLDLRWFEDRPLLGRRVALCRAAGAQSSALATRLRRLGAEAIEVPTIELAAGDAVPPVRQHDWVVFTSPNAVEPVFAGLHDARAFGDAKVAAIGPGTAAALAARGVVPDLLPATSLAESLVEAMGPGDGRTVLLPQAAAARPVLADGLRANGWAVTTAVAYRTVAATPPPDLLAAAAKADAIAFTSSSTVENYVAATTTAGADAGPATVVCIGPVTAETAGRLGLPVTAVAASHDLDGLVDAVVAVLRREP